MQPIKIYLSAPIANNPDGYVAHFESLELWATAFFGDWIKNRPVEIVNPLNLPHEHGHTPEEYLAEDLIALETCDVIILGEGWENSSGCLQEHKRAVELGIEILPEEIIEPQTAGMNRCMDGRTECCGQFSNYLCKLLAKFDALE